MVTERLHITSDDGKEFTPEIRYDVVAYKKYVILEPFNIPAFKLQWFSEWENRRKCTIVDVNAPRWYIKLAALCDAIDQGGLYEDLLPDKLPLPGNTNRRAEVEKFIVNLAGKNYRSAYITARETMYQTLLDAGLYCSSTELVIRQTLDYLNSLHV